MMSLWSIFIESNEVVVWYDLTIVKRYGLTNKMSWKLQDQVDRKIVKEI